MKTHLDGMVAVIISVSSSFDNECSARFARCNRRGAFSTLSGGFRMMLKCGEEDHRA